MVPVESMVPVEALVFVGVAGGAAAATLALFVFHDHTGLGVTAFVASLLLVGLGSVAVGVGLFRGWLSLAGDAEGFRRALVVVWFLGTVPWLVFAFRYTGKYARISRLTAVVIFLPYGLLGLQFLLSAFETFGVSTLAIVGQLASLHTLGLVGLGVYFLVSTSYSYGHVSVWQGLTLGSLPVVTLLLWTVTSIVTELDPVVAASSYAIGSAAMPVGTALAVFRYDAFDSRPAVGTLAERSIVDGTADLTLVVDDHDRITLVNQTACDLLDVDPTAVHDRPLEAVLGHESDALATTETVAVDTVEGTRRYDPQVSAVTDPDDRRLGSVVSLRDVTERQLREQRLAVLNRVLRHNLRNRMDVVKARAEALADLTERANPEADPTDADRETTTNRETPTDANSAAGQTPTDANSAAGQTPTDANSVAGQTPDEADTAVDGASGGGATAAAASVSRSQQSAGARHAAAIVDVAEEITTLGREARSVDQFVSASGDTSTVVLADHLHEVLAALDTETSDTEVHLDVPASVRLTTNSEALSAALESVIENAVTHAESRVEIDVTDGPEECVIRIADDGPGIPEGELELLDAGTEDPLQHGRGLGLWRLKWAVVTMNGRLAFDTADGTAVTIRLPRRDEDAAAPGELARDSTGN